MRPNSSSAERRQKQDRQSLIALAILVVTAFVGYVSEGASTYCCSALQGAVAPLVIYTLRYLYRLIASFNLDTIAIIDSMGFACMFLGILILIFEFDTWHILITLGMFLFVVMGIQKLRFKPLFVLLNCMMAGAILL